MGNTATERILPIWVVYRYPIDFPRHHVVRIQWVTAAGDIETSHVGCLYESLSDAMHDCQVRGLTWLGRHPHDEPQIVGTWV